MKNKDKANDLPHLYLMLNGKMKIKVPQLQHLIQSSKNVHLERSIWSWSQKPSHALRSKNLSCVLEWNL